MTATQPSVNSPTAWTGPGIASFEQPLYKLPYDHQYHGGPFYQTNDLQDWQYISFLGKDLDTGNDIAIFWATLSQGWVTAENRPMQNGLFLWHDMTTGEFKSSLLLFKGRFRSEANDPNAKDFYFKYGCGDETSSFGLEYTHATEHWHMQGATTIRSESSTPFRLDMHGEVKAPGYIPMAYWGLESIGVDPEDRQNPETMYGLTYYYGAPNMLTTGTIEVDGRKATLEGWNWYERQWGNFRNTENLRYFYGYCRLQNGDMFTWRQYYGSQGWLDPHVNVNRFQYITKDGRREHAFGPALRCTPTKFWKSPRTGKEYPWWGVMETPKGKYFYGPEWPDQESIGLQGGFVEGVLFFREGAPDGPIVGTGFCELVDLPPEGPTVTRQLPEKPELFWRPMR